VSGVVHQISVSGGGVPKSAVDSSYVGPLGLLEDAHTESFHGGPEKALCLYSLEIIRQLQSDGHPLAPGSAGENLTVAGVDWDLVTPGTRWQIGHEVEIEITHYTTPCNKNSRWFVDGDISQMNQQIYPGRSRVYARVISEGAIRVGDQFEVTD
jgi:MOSC domain-containing protein YiiM